MNKNNCEVIKDLLPLYSDGVCSEESRKIVAEHISQCSECMDELEKMGGEIMLTADKDVKVIKRIRRRIVIERWLIGGAVALAALIFLWFGYFFLVNTDCSMDYERYNLAENVWVEESANGDLWLVTKGDASAADFIYPAISDENGNLMAIDDDFDKDKKKGYGVTLHQRKIDALAMTSMSEEMEKRIFIKNKNDFELSEIFYYDDENDKQYVLWERE